MFSVQQKREIAEAVQGVLRATGHPELPAGEIQFALHVDGAEPWSWADIRNNGAVESPTVNPHNESQDSRCKCPAGHMTDLRETYSRARRQSEGFCRRCRLPYAVDRAFEMLK